MTTGRTLPISLLALALLAALRGRLRLLQRRRLRWPAPRLRPRPGRLAARRWPPCTSRRTSCSRRDRRLRKAARGAAGATRWSSTSGPPGAGPAASSSRSCRSSRPATASGSPSSASTPRTPTTPPATFLEEAPVPYPSYTDPDKEIADSVGASLGFPDTAFYDRGGKLVYLKQGPYAQRVRTRSRRSPLRVGRHDVAHDRDHRPRCWHSALALLHRRGARCRPGILGGARDRRRSSAPGSIYRDEGHSLPVVVIVAVALLLGGPASSFAARKVLAAYRDEPVRTGYEEMVGELRRRSAPTLDPEGQVFLQGAIWHARLARPRGPSRRGG